MAAFMATGIWAYYQLKNSKKPKVEAISLLPDSCVVYLNTSRFFELNKKINAQSLIADKLKLFGDVNKLCATLIHFDSLFASHELLKAQLESNLVHFALYGGNKDWLISFNLKQLGEQNEMTEALAKVLSSKKLNDLNYQFEIDKNKSWYYSLNAGVALLSNSSSLLEKAQNQATAKFEKNKSYQSFKNTLNEGDLLSIYVNEEAYGLSSLNQFLNLTAVCKKGTSVGSVDFQPSQLKVNGYMSVDSAEVLSALLNQNAQSPDDVISQLPLNTVSFKAYGFNDFVKLQQQIHARKSQALNDYWQQINTLALFNLEHDFYANADNHLLQFELLGNKQSLISLAVMDSLKSLEHLKLMSDSTWLIDSSALFRLKSPKSSGLKLFSPLFHATLRYASYWSNHLFFAENLAALSDALYQLKHGQVLEKNERFVTYKNQYFIDDFNYLIYISPSQQKESISSFFNFSNTSLEDPFANFKHFSYSVTNNVINFKFRFHLLHESENLNKENNVLWTLKLDTTASLKPGAFVNHVSKENEVLIQDDAKNLYLINAKGTILWKKIINESMRSKFFMVDMFKNNKYQILFSTKNYLHLIDRNGKYVDGYPVKLPTEATSDLSLFDYDNDRDYRLFIACKNNVIYNYSIYGIKQEGFTSLKTESTVDLPIQYVKVGKSDYLVALDNEGKIYTFSRKGVGRIGLRNRTVAHCKAFYVDASATINNTYLVYVDDINGHINKISFSDIKEIVKLNNEMAHAGLAFNLVDDNRNMDLIISHANKVMAFNFSGNLISEKNSDENLSCADYFSDESHALYYALNESHSDLYLFDQINNKTRKLSAGSMPLISNLFKDNKNYLLFPNGKQMTCVLLN